MKIAIDKYSKDIIKKPNNEYIYLFNDEPYNELIETKMHCLYYKKCGYVDINLTDFNISCTKKAKITDKDFDILPDKVNYKYAIIVPNYNNDHGSYNGKTFLRNCIESIINQTYKDYTLIIVDDCSDDTSVETIKSYQEDNDNIRLIQNKRKRYNGGSRNVGIDYALDNCDFDYFCFLDSDDWWVDEKVLDTINNRLYGHELLTIGCQMLFSNGSRTINDNKARSYRDLWSLSGNLWCTAWARIIRKDKIVYFCEDTMMEDRVWTYKLADNLNFDNVVSITEPFYVWNRMNVTQSVSIVRDDFWNASAFCHIGHQLQFVNTIKHKEMIPIIQDRIKECRRKVNNDEYQQY